MTAIEALDYASVFVFALTGALTASRAQLDIIGFVFLANLTAVGGGTIRDLLLDRHPIFWIDAPSFIVLATLAAALVFATAHLFESRLRLLLWLDAFALSVAVAAGAGVALSLGHSAIIVALMGAVTGTMGGLMRDVVANEVPLALRQGELYVTAAFAGALAALITTQLTQNPLAALASCTAVTLILRAGSLAFGWRLPVYKSRPPKP
jgi:uncharacterized membrane protein YeiH